MAAMSSHHARAQGEVFLDTRGGGRAMRLTWHHEADLVVLSLWRDGSCAGTFRLSRADVNEFVDALVDGLRDESTFPVLDEAPPPSFTEWAFRSDDRANAS
jgi:hypothetical protein